jgi:hypothetical protein
MRLALLGEFARFCCHHIKLCSQLADSIRFVLAQQPANAERRIFCSAITPDFAVYAICRAPGTSGQPNRTKRALCDQLLMAI